jgi:potassium large conductance calcium-activated channel subfamily M alpha protein 1
LPPQFQDKKFGELFEGLTQDFKMVPLGLYRAAKIKKNSKPYVFLKPPYDVKLNNKDRIYVLSIKQPKECKEVLRIEAFFCYMLLLIIF